mgnify:CR=1 FL=1
MFEFRLSKRYSCGDIAEYYAECARRIGEQVQQGIVKKDKVFDACVVDFINHQVNGDFGMCVSDIYSDKHRGTIQKQSYEKIADADIEKIAYMAKYRYLKDVSLAGDKANTLTKSVKINEHMHEDLRGEKINNRIVEENIDKFLIISGQQRGVKINTCLLKYASEQVSFEQSSTLKDEKSL